jgi:Na+/melibiose symporter-like transporter
MFVLVDQMKFVKGNYWVEPITGGSILKLVSYCLTYSNNQIVIILSAIVFVLIVAFLIKKFVENKGTDNLYLLMGVLVFVGTLAFGYLLSVGYKPILVDRYLIPSIGVFWLSVSILLSKLDLKKSVVVLIILMIVIVGAFNVYHEVKEIQKTNDHTIKEAKVLEKINNNKSIVIYDTDNHYIRTHMDLNNISKGYGNVTIIKYHNSLNYKFDGVEYEPFVIPDDISKNPDKDVYFMRFYTMKAKFPNNVNATKVGTAQHADFYKLKMK